jgi:K+-sensing histidine kinase KdpD
MTKSILISNLISNIRYITKSIDLNQKNDKDIFLSFKELSKFVFENFDILSTHADYIAKSFKNRSVVLNSSIEDFIISYGNQYDFELPLRAVEVVFSYAEDEDKMQDVHKIIKLKYLIAKLHHYVGRKYFELVDENEFSLN